MSTLPPLDPTRPRWQYYLRGQYYLLEDDVPQFQVGDVVRAARRPKEYEDEPECFEIDGLADGELAVVEDVHFIAGCGWAASARGQTYGELAEDYMAYVFELVAPAVPDHTAEIAGIFGLT